MAVSVVDQETGEIEPAEFPDVRLNQKFVQMRQGRPFVAYPGLLDLLHQLSEGFFAIDTEVLQLPTAENNLTAVVQARVRIFDPQDADVVRRLHHGHRRRRPQQRERPDETPPPQNGGVRPLAGRDADPQWLEAPQRPPRRGRGAHVQPQRRPL